MGSPAGRSRFSWELGGAPELAVLLPWPAAVLGEPGRGGWHLFGPFAVPLLSSWGPCWAQGGTVLLPAMSPSVCPSLLLTPKAALLVLSPPPVQRGDLGKGSHHSIKGAAGAEGGGLDVPDRAPHMRPYDVSPSQPSKYLWARGPVFWGSLEPGEQPPPPAPCWGAWTAGGGPGRPTLALAAGPERAGWV